ncbi:hypothetical protein IPG41_01955 [Candidatus Peregrinibacteria bacterium]|nr:MAG: hypothetical protein IPG41_01955 [Candidatus Peregrinibacteria bacterium]
MEGYDVGLFFCFMSLKAGLILDAKDQEIGRWDQNRFPHQQAGDIPEEAASLTYSDLRTGQTFQLPLENITVPKLRIYRQGILRGLRYASELCDPRHDGQVEEDITNLHCTLSSSPCLELCPDVDRWVYGPRKFDPSPARASTLTLPASSLYDDMRLIPSVLGVEAVRSCLLGQAPPAREVFFHADIHNSGPWNYGSHLEGWLVGSWRISTEPYYPRRGITLSVTDLQPIEFNKDQSGECSARVLWAATSLGVIRALSEQVIITQRVKSTRCGDSFDKLLHYSVRWAGSRP